MILRRLGSEKEVDDKRQSVMLNPPEADEASPILNFTDEEEQ
jgi:hypothetical protein